MISFLALVSSFAIPERGSWSGIRSIFISHRCLGCPQSIFRASFSFSRRATRASVRRAIWAPSSRDCTRSIAARCGRTR